MSCVYHAFAPVHCCLVVICWPLGSCLRCLILLLSLSNVVSWARCGTWLYWFLIFAVFLTLTPCTGLDKENLEHKIVNIFLFINFNICFRCSKEQSHWSKLFDTLMVFLKEFFEKVDFEKLSKRQKTWKISQGAKSQTCMCSYLEGEKSNSWYGPSTTSMFCVCKQLRHRRDCTIV